MKKIASFVFLDLETTGIPVYEHNKTKITELSMIAVKSLHLADLNSTGTPRVQHKLTLCLNPLRFIHPEVTAITKLNNEMLEHEPCFNLEVFRTIDSFINLLEKPVCLVAYNGLGFDYPLLKNRLQYLNVTLPDDLLCLDACDAFYFLLEKKLSQPSPSINYSSNIMDIHLKSKTQDLCFNENKPFDNKGNKQQQSQNASVDNDLVIKSEIDRKFSKQHLEKTILNQYKHTETERQSEESHALVETYNAVLEPVKNEHSIEVINNTTPTQKKQENYCSVPKKISVNRKSVKNHARRRLPWSVGEKPKVSYKLVDVYERLLNHRAIDSHKAEADCLLMLECSAVLSEKFIEWANQNKVLFSDIEPMQLGVPL